MNGVNDDIVLQVEDLTVYYELEEETVKAVNNISFSLKRGETIGLVRVTPWEAVVIAADTALKSADVQIGFMDRFCGSLILTGELVQVETAVKAVVKFFEETLHFHTCPIYKS